MSRMADEQSTGLPAPVGFYVGAGILALAVLALARLIQGVPGDELAIWWLLFVGLLVLGVLVNLLALRKRLLADQRLRREKVGVGPDVDQDADRSGPGNGGPDRRPPDVPNAPDRATRRRVPLVRFAVIAALVLVIAVTIYVVPAAQMGVDGGGGSEEFLIWVILGGALLAVIGTQLRAKRPESPSESRPEPGRPRPVKRIMTRLNSAAAEYEQFWDVVGKVIVPLLVAGIGLMGVIIWQSDSGDASPDATTTTTTTSTTTTTTTPATEPG